MELGTVIAVIQLTEHVLSTVCKYYSNVKDARHDIMALVQELKDFESVVKNLERSLPKDKSSLQAPALAEL